MKTLFELAMWTLFFSVLAGIGLTVGFYGCIGALIWIREV